jgi:hypothetical protein
MLLIVPIAACSSVTPKGSGTGDGGAGRSAGGSSAGGAAAGAGAGGGGPAGGGGRAAVSGDAGSSSGGSSAGGGAAGAGGSGAGGAGGLAGASGGGVSAHDACVQVQNGWATFIEHCDGELPGYYKTLSVPTVRCTAVAASVAAGRVIYDPSQLGKCLGDTSSQTCAQWYGDTTPVCTMFTGTLGEGGACHTYEECKNGFCDLHDACPGVCHPYVGVSSPCDNKTKFCDPRTSVCGSGFTCVALTHPGLGDACGQEGAYCNAAVSWCDGTNHCVARQTSGPCTLGNECALGTICAGPQKATTCQLPVGLGGGCTPGTTQCQYPGACDAATNTCVERKVGDPCGQINLPENQVCVESTCIYNAKTSGTCTAYRQDGESCGSGLPSCLASSTCRGGMCSPTECL